MKRIRNRIKRRLTATIVNSLRKGSAAKSKAGRGGRREGGEGDKAQIKKER